MSLSIEDLLRHIAQLPRDEQEFIITLVQKRLDETDKNDRHTPPSIGFWF